MSVKVRVRVGVSEWSGVLGTSRHLSHASTSTNKSHRGTVLYHQTMLRPPTPTPAPDSPGGTNDACPWNPRCPSDASCHF